MAADVRCWQLGPDGRWTRREGRDHQSGLVAAVGELAG
jgi:polyphosphate kinase